MKKTSLKLFLVIIGICCFILINPTKVNAVLQSNGGTSATKVFGDWIVQIRQMEEMGGTLGLNETINTTGLLSTTDSNGLDCHMEKNTEYGAMILLSASSYGNPSKIESGGTTTGNSTGVVMNINNEWVAAGAKFIDTEYARSADERYINNGYGTTPGGVYYRGDAMKQGAWHGSGATAWWDTDRTGALVRAHYGSIFSYGGKAYGGSVGVYSNSWSSRAVIVIGEGL